MINRAHLRQRAPLVVAATAALALGIGAPLATAAPRTPMGPVGAMASSASPVVVTIGDSYSSGTGLHKDDWQYDEQYGGLDAGLKLTSRSDNECWRETNDTPGPRLAAAKGVASIFYACKGAEAQHVRNQWALVQARNPGQAASGWAGSVITLTAGGNDVRTADGRDWPTLLTNCIMKAVNMLEGCHKKSSSQITNWWTVRNNLVELYADLARDAPNAKIRVLGYPRLMTPRKNWLGWHCPDVTGITGNEAVWFDAQSDMLNGHVANAVDAAKAANPALDIKYVSVTSYLPVGACYGENGASWVNDKVLQSNLDPLNPSDSSFHPSARGYEGYTQALFANQ
ncbi:MAG TPA: GDSL-type esterase/lipase family protein [Phycicoccus sp.]|nr:GDSL-type esterase/lipase family protein [Phycicoccus sp.]